jgi:hypothetical protein
MVAKNPQIAWLRDGIVGRLGHIVRIGQTLLHVRIKESGQVVRRESDQVEIEIHPLQVGQFDWQQVVIPFGQFGSLVVGQAICLHLRRRQPFRDVDRHLFQFQFFGCLETGVADNDDAVLVDDDRLAESKLLTAFRELSGTSATTSAIPPSPTY